MSALGQARLKVALLAFFILLGFRGTKSRFFELSKILLFLKGIVFS